MIFFFKVCLGLIAVAGISTAVAVPLSLSTDQSRTDGRLGTLVSAGGGGGSSSRESFSLKKCEAEGQAQSSVSFGSGNLSDYCWTNNDSSSNTQNDSLVSNLLGSAWGQSSSWSQLRVSGIKDYCVDTNSSSQNHVDQNSILLRSGNGSECTGTEYLKLGDSSSFIKKQPGADNSNLQVWLCSGECWNNFDKDVAQQPVQEKSENWKTLSFRNTSSSR